MRPAAYVGNHAPTHVKCLGRSAHRVRPHSRSLHVVRSIAGSSEGAAPLQLRLACCGDEDRLHTYLRSPPEACQVTRATERSPDI